jgi:hypothetical protein
VREEEDEKEELEKGAEGEKEDDKKRRTERGREK